MPIHHRKKNGRPCPVAVADTAPTHEKPLIAKRRPTIRRDTASPGLGSARTPAKRSAAEQREARRLAAETRQKESDDRFTSRVLLDPIEISFGEIDFDPCWHSASAVRPKAYLDVREGHNGLRDPWFGTVAFMNPPWSAQDKWVKRAYEQWRAGNVKIVVCLVPAATSAAVFHRTLAHVADIFFLEGRPRFSKVDRTSEPTMVNAMIVVFGATAEQKQRFAELVRGRWMPREVPRLAGTGNPFSCAPTPLDGKTPPVVLCTRQCAAA
jgi:hypothetical protein